MFTNQPPLAPQSNEEFYPFLGEMYSSDKPRYTSAPLTRNTTSVPASHSTVEVDIQTSATSLPADNEDTSESENHIQFATYPEEKFGAPQQLIGPPPRALNHRSKTWTPLPLRPYFWIPLIVILVVAATGLEIALYFSNKHQGWASEEDHRRSISIALHYAYTLPPVILASVIATLWTWTDAEIKKIQPYVDLVYGDSPPDRSLLLDYSRYSTFFVWARAASNRHYFVALASLMTILTFSFQPLAASLLIVKDIWWQLPDATMKNLGAIGLNQSLQFSDLTSFVTGAGYAGASILYDLPTPPFVSVPYTVAAFELPTTINNGTAFVNTTAVKTTTDCQAIPVTGVQLRPGAWFNSVSFNGCSTAWNVTNSSDILFGADILLCGDDAEQFSPVVFWFFKYTPSPMASATLCYPSFSLWEVNVGVDVRTGNVTRVSEIRPFSQDSKFSSFSGNVTGPPLNGRAYNGIKFNLSTTDQYILGRQNATQLQLPAAIYQAATQSPGGYIGGFDNGGSRFGTLSNEVYGKYLALVAQQIYFLSIDEPINVEVRTFRKRVFLSDITAHLLTAALLVLAIFATFIHFFHLAGRQDLKLQHEPGTIASAVSIGAETGVGHILAGRRSEDDIKQALQNKKFRIDPATMKIIMEGESGYETATALPSPMWRRMFTQSPRSPSFPQPQGSPAEDQISLSVLGPRSPKSPHQRTV